jgi:hypothetical protein
MAYKLPVITTRIFDESKQLKDLKVKEVEPFKDEIDIIPELYSLEYQDVCAKLIYYCKKKDEKMVSSILSESQVDPNFTDHSGNSPLHYAVYYGQLKIVSKLLYFGSDNNLINKYSETAIEAGEASIKSNIESKRFIKNNKYIDQCLEQIKTWNGRVKIDELKGDEHILKIRENLNKIQDSNKKEILRNISSKISYIIENVDKIERVFDIIFKMAKDNDTYICLYVEVCICILKHDIFYDKRLASDIFMNLLWREYLNSLKEPTLKENENMIKFMIHFYKFKILKRKFVEKIINDLFDVIEQSLEVSHDGEQYFKEQECIRLLQIILITIKNDFEHELNSKYYDRIIELQKPEYNVKPRLQFMVQDYIDMFN